jgi:hypothetical protein
MPNELLKYDLTHIVGFSIFLIAMVIAAWLIVRFTKKYEKVVVSWIPYFFIIALVFGRKFL